MRKCVLCERNTKNLEKHHIEPGKKRRKNKITIEVCEQCGDQLHLMFTNNELRNNLNSIFKIKNHPKVKKYINWIKNKPINKYFSIKRKKRRK